MGFGKLHRLVVLWQPSPNLEVCQDRLVVISTHLEQDLMSNGQIISITYWFPRGFSHSWLLANINKEVEFIPVSTCLKVQLEVLSDRPKERA
jgi:hypothetical protein